MALPTHLATIAVAASSPSKKKSANRQNMMPMEAPVNQHFGRSSMEAPMNQHFGRTAQTFVASTASRASLVGGGDPALQFQHQFQPRIADPLPPFVTRGREPQQLQQQQQAYWYNYERQNGHPPPPMMQQLQETALNDPEEVEREQPVAQPTNAQQTPKDQAEQKKEKPEEKPEGKSEEKPEEKSQEKPEEKTTPSRFGLYDNATKPKLAAPNYPVKEERRGRPPGPPSDWDEMYAQLVEYKKETGSSKIPKNDTSKFGNWVKNQRFNLGKLKRNGLAPAGSKMALRIAKMDEIGFEWPKSRLSTGGTASPAKTDQPAKPAEGVDAAKHGEGAGEDSQKTTELSNISAHDAGTGSQKTSGAPETAGAAESQNDAKLPAESAPTEGLEQSSESKNADSSDRQPENSHGEPQSTTATTTPKAKVKTEDGTKAVRTPAVLLWEGPPEEDLGTEAGWPPGWVKKVFQRTSGTSAGSRDRYWFSPGGRKFRSMVQIRNFLELVEKHNGDEEAAWKDRNPEGGAASKERKRSLPAAPKAEGESATTSPSKKSKTQRRQRKNTITVFSTVPNLANALREANPELSILEMEDDALTHRNVEEPFDASDLSKKSLGHLARAEILVTEPSILANLMDEEKVQMDRLVWCQSTCAGVDPLFPLPEKYKTPSFLLTRMAGVFGQPIAEWCMGRIISQERNFDLSRRDQGHKAWAGSREVLSYRFLTELTLTILGCGDIGMCIAKAAKSFGMTVVGYVREGEREPNPYIDEFTSSLETAFNRADYIVSVLPSTPETRGLLDTPQLLRQGCKTAGGKCPVFINVGRGDIVSAKTLVRALNRGYLKTAILDVLEEEPLPIDSPLWDHPQVVISPHVSGMTRSQDVPKLLLENYQRYINRQPLLHAVDWEKTY